MSNPERIEAPSVYGYEEETGLLIDFSDGNGFHEPYSLVENMPDFLPEGIVHQKQFMSNGSRIYSDRAVAASNSPSVANLERATPECETPTELVAYIRSSEEMLVQLVSNYVEHESRMRNGSTVRARIQRRNVDCEGSRKGCHDNFSVKLPDVGIKKAGRMLLHGSMLGHLVTRPFVTGAGYVDMEHGPSFSQKAGGLAETYGHNFRGSMYYHEASDGDRLEIRCGDVNISDWATMMRIGSTSLSALIAKTPLRDEFPNIAEHDWIYRQADAFNRFKISPDGSLMSRGKLNEALSFQRHIAELACSDLVDYVGELEEDLAWTAAELLRYCDDFEKVLNGEADIATLADRADWAAKFQIIQRDYTKRREISEGASYADLRAQSLDLFYDYIGVTARDGKLEQPEYGYGYTLRDRGKFKYTAPESQIQRGVYEPPRGTRAAPRSELIKEQKVEKISWSYVDYRSGDRLMRACLTDLTGNKPTEVVHIIGQAAI